MHTFAYDAAGRMTSDGVNTYAWDRANRLLSMGSVAYQYNGLGQRLQQTVGAQVTQYLLDVQPGLWQVLAATEGSDTTRYVHGPTDLLSEQKPDESWRWPVMDGLGSVRGAVGDDLNVLESRLYSPFREMYGQTLAPGATPSVFGFTGEPTDANGLVQLRARYYSPTLGVFASIDPLEGGMAKPMSLNRYSYVQGNVANMVDPSGYGPNINEIGTAYDYSCNCGWIDWHHVEKSEELTYNLLDDLEYVRNNPPSDSSWLSKWGIYFGIPITGAILFGGTGLITGDLYHDYAVMPHTSVQSIGRIDLATSIFMDANIRFEDLQGAAAQTLLGSHLPQLTTSVYSEEDLVSDLIGFYVGLQRNLTKTNPQGSTSEQLKNQIKSMCGVMSVSDAQSVFQNTYANGANTLTGWRNWYPRLLPLLGCQNCVCPTPRKFPSEFIQLTSRRIPPQVNEIWWWSKDDQPPGGTWGPTDRPLVLALYDNPVAGGTHSAR